METDSSSAIRTLNPGTLAGLQAWTGRSETLADDIVAAPIAGLSATLDRDDVAPRPGTGLPPLWHWLFFLPRARQSEIGIDGHPRRGGFLPPVPLPRRMWAGGRLKWELDNPLVVGDAVRRVSTIKSVTHKRGRTGDLVFVLVKHEVYSPRGLALTEEHDIIYRPLAQAGDPVPPPVAAPADVAWRQTVTSCDVLLFRYSALTFNGHRIHYDRRYVTEVEGYPGLVVHGPLIATLLVDLLHRQDFAGRKLARFEFKAVRPTFDLHPFTVNGRLSGDGQTVALWAADHEGWLTMQASATLG